MERVLLLVPNRGQQCEYNNINVHDGYVRLWMEVPYPTVALYEILHETLFHCQNTPHNQPPSPFVKSTVVKNIENDIGTQTN